MKWPAPCGCTETTMCVGHVLEVRRKQVPSEKVPSSRIEMATWLRDYADVLRMHERWEGGPAMLDEAAAALEACDIALSARGLTPDDVLADVERRLHDMKNLQTASAWPHVQGVAMAEKMVRELRSSYVNCQSSNEKK